MDNAHFNAVADALVLLLKSSIGTDVHQRLMSVLSRMRLIEALAYRCAGVFWVWEIGRFIEQNCTHVVDVHIKIL